MKSVHLVACALIASLVFHSFGSAQSDRQASSSQTATTVPLFVRTQGIARDEAGKPLSGQIRMTFTVYKDGFGQSPVWQEIQDVKLDSTGHYSVLLGIGTEGGIPIQLFGLGDARWLGVRPDGHPEQPLIALVSVPYALKAADADTLNGIPASAFLLANTQIPSKQAGASSDSAKSSGIALPQTACSTITSDGTGTTNQISKFTSPCNIQNSAIFESGGKVGIGTTAPAGPLDVNGAAFIRGSIDLSQGAFIEPVQTATTSQGYASSPLDLAASVYNTSVPGPVDYLFRWQSTPVGNDTANPSAALNLLYGVSGLVNATGFSIANNGIVTFAKGQTFPGLGTVTSVATGAGLTGGPITSSGTISIPSAGVTNTMLANSAVTVTAGSGLSGGGTVALGGTITLTNSAPSSGGTVTSIATGAGLTGGPITKTGTISIPAAGVTNAMLANPSLTVLAGSGLSGGGTVALGGTVTLSANVAGTTNGLGYFSAPTIVTSTAAPTNGQILIGSSGKAPALATLTAGSNVSITNGPGSITISAGSSGGAPSLPFFITAGGRNGTTQGATKNVTAVWGFLLPYSVTTTQITYDIITADKTANSYDIGIYSNEGKLVADVGPLPGTTFSPSASFITVAWTQGSVTLEPGRYYIAFTTNCASACAKVSASANNISFATGASAGASASGTLPATISPPSDNWKSGIQPALIFR